MVTMHPKSGDTYLKAYQNLMERARAFDQSELDQDAQPDQVLLDQVIRTGPGIATEVTHLILKAQLQSSDGLAPSGPISVEVRPDQRNPSTRLEFRPSGNKLHVLEDHFKPSQENGERRTFVIDFATGAVSEVQQEAASRRLFSSLDPALKQELTDLGRDVSNLGFTISKPNFV